MTARHTTILAELQEKQRVSVRELAARLRVSEMTVRRDLAALETQGYLTRTHGGGVATGKFRFTRQPFLSYTLSPCKTAIGRLAAGLVQPEQTVMIDTGLTSLEVARHLPPDMNLTVATTSLCVVQELYGSPLNLLLLGGFVQKEFPSTYGPLTEDALHNLRIDTLFMGCDGASSLDGFYTADIHVGSLEQEMIHIAHRVVVVTESDKFTRRALMRYARVNEVHTLVTDAGLPAEDRANLEAAGVTVLIACEQS